MLEQQRRPAAGLLHHAVGDLAQLEVRLHRLTDAHELTGRVERLYELVQRVEGHSVAPSYTWSRHRARAGIKNARTGTVWVCRA